MYLITTIMQPKGPKGIIVKNLKMRKSERTFWNVTE
jgi:hypothetical protein